MNGYIHSVESFGTVDGPGIRFVVFFQGCPMRCQYCHNPDTWEINTGKKVASDDLMKMFEKNKEFYSNGGITATGGEPLLQIDFLTEFFQLAKKQGVHTCIDTSGVTFNINNSEYLSKIDSLLDVTDLVMLDLKHIDDSEHKKLTGHSNRCILEFAKYLDKKGIPVWIRHVLVPGITDNEMYLSKLGSFIGGLSNIKALDVLPYHTLGVNKYHELGIPYALENVPQADLESTKKARSIIINSFKKQRKLKK